MYWKKILLGGGWIPICLAFRRGVNLSWLPGVLFLILCCYFVWRSSRTWLGCLDGFYWWGRWNHLNLKFEKQWRPGLSDMQISSWLLSPTATFRLCRSTRRDNRILQKLYQVQQIFCCCQRRGSWLLKDRSGLRLNFLIAAKDILRVFHFQFIYIIFLLVLNMFIAVSIYITNWYICYQLLSPTYL